MNIKPRQRMLIPLVLFFSGLCLTASEKKAQYLDHVASLVDLRESINLFFDAPVFDEKLERLDENPCREIYFRYKNLTQQKVETSLHELTVRFPYYIQLRTYEKATALGFCFHFMLRGHEISDSFDIYFIYNDSNVLSRVGRGGGVMEPVPNARTPNAVDGQKTKSD